MIDRSHLIRKESSFASLSPRIRFLHVIEMARHREKHTHSNLLISAEFCSSNYVFLRLGQFHAVEAPRLFLAVCVPLSMSSCVVLGEGNGDDGLCI